MTLRLYKKYKMEGSNNIHFNLPYVSNGVFVWPDVASMPVYTNLHNAYKHHRGYMSVVGAPSKRVTLNYNGLKINDGVYSFNNPFPITISSNIPYIKGVKIISMDPITVRYDIKHIVVYEEVTDKYYGFTYVDGNLSKTLIYDGVVPVGEYILVSNNLEDLGTIDGKEMGYNTDDGVVGYTYTEDKLTNTVLYDKEGNKLTDYSVTYNDGKVAINNKDTFTTGYDSIYYYYVITSVTIALVLFLHKIISV